jgi:glycosyltransferase involved in cell wall biosynthesis
MGSTMNLSGNRSENLQGHVCYRLIRCGADLRNLIAIPVFNERKYVEQVLRKVRGYSDQILLIDDGSTDGTADYLAGRSDIHLIRHPENRGYGQSLIDAFAWADARGFDWVITMDCDEQHEPERIPDFVREIETDRWDLISGSRYMLEMADNDLPPTDRRSINKFITSTVNDCYGLKLTDAFCGFKAHRLSAMRKLKLDIPGYAFPMQLWPQVAAAKLRVTEIPVRLIYKDATRHFGGLLDDPDNRLKHYLDVLCSEQKRIDASALERSDVPCPCGSD